MHVVMHVMHVKPPETAEIRQFDDARQTRMLGANLEVWHV